MSEHHHALTTCQICQYEEEINCFPNFEFEKRFYLEFKPDCPKCAGRDWSIKEIVEVRKPLSNEERAMFSMGKRDLQ